jgi:hypothetical protein
MTMYTRTFIKTIHVIYRCLLQPIDGYNGRKIGYIKVGKLQVNSQTHHNVYKKFQ